MARLSDRKRQILAQFDLQELALLVSEAIAVESDRQGGNYTLDRLSREFGHLAFKYSDVLKSLPSSSESGASYQPTELSSNA